MQSRITSCQKLLEDDGVLENMIGYADGLHQNLKTFGESVRGIMSHLTVSEIIVRNKV